MKILGVKTDTYGREAEAYIVEITVQEIQAVANKVSYSERKDFSDLKAGDDYPISEGFDFHRAISTATKSMEQAYLDFAKVAPVMQKFVQLVSQPPTAADEPKEA